MQQQLLDGLRHPGLAGEVFGGVREPQGRGEKVDALGERSHQALLQWPGAQGEQRAGR
ncbi:hypothetical protein [Streptomyces sp. C8S0]|uniref:hypothetical protein n=1 Tax=Streptomyces sp. C8S0 TaxID=2585716 RepID=UPI001D046313|nr:hypothetical protein [Streptomyces sp. C8S0]